MIRREEEQEVNNNDDDDDDDDNNDNNDDEDGNDSFSPTEKVTQRSIMLPWQSSVKHFTKIL